MNLHAFQANLRIYNFCRLFETILNHVENGNPQCGFRKGNLYPVSVEDEKLNCRIRRITWLP